MVHNELDSSLQHKRHLIMFKKERQLTVLKRRGIGDDALVNHVLSYHRREFNIAHV